MSEAEIMERLFEALGAILSIVSLFLGIVSGYLAALFFFLGRAPFFLRLLAFGLMSISFVFLGGNALVIGTIQEGLFTAWRQLGSPSITIGDLRNPLPLPPLPGITQQELGVGLGWAVAVTVYLALAYMTFLYRWPDPDRLRGGF